MLDGLQEIIQKIIKYGMPLGLGVFLFIVVVIPFYNATLGKEGNTEKLREFVIDTIDKTCVAQEIIKGNIIKVENITQELIDGLPTDTWQQAKAKVIMQKAFDGIELTDSEYVTLINNLDRYHKLKFGLYDLEILCQLV